MSGSRTTPGPVVAGTTVAAPAPVATMAECYFCGDMPAVVYCRADASGLCLPCDRHVHSANTVSSRHARAPLCAACRATGASVRRGGAARFLCSDCDFEERSRGGDPVMHDRGTVEGYTGCPSVAELAAILGVFVHGCGGKKAQTKEGCRPVWEEPRVLTFEDVIVPTTSCHGLQPLVTSSSPKNQSPPCGEPDGEVIRQLSELAKSEVAAAYVEAEPTCDLMPPWASSGYGFGHGDFGALGTEAVSEEAPSVVVPCQHHEAWIAVDRSDVSPDKHEQVPASSPAEPSLSVFVEMAEVCPALSRSSSIDVANGSHDDHPPAPVAAMTAPEPELAQPKSGGYHIAYPDRSMVISRYKEKRKNRIFGKQIRYESRKARADSRPRIKGRFAKSSDI
ncbi:zinc finger protein CONSTANS-LIKE 13-like isoform X1 [Lolium perenne]|uniref:zinc finger protein CONSTANS-LIKE 13-like isoform X1 n=1 Tax=Lolium perenne TaxID=4522 RepID=UPI0021F5E6EA|nr:zinc finger protein CONSTANS-LIKE 13-like isoform X1 [Lolium perenne]